ncbi:hypothetical protein IW261DRAFT_1470461 [Armillaria novae-zelandiae]|uniref:Mid2 domain-containing protein n=1 Tax=Armillaria novae-zelandiae TaxID=153914 RepID=A0AA39PBW2_9AGAR|nr:hypothetical protein IW261DRAFT_1470461 [Armillaria novae-zelandiae]
MFPVDGFAPLLTTSSVHPATISLLHRLQRWRVAVVRRLVWYYDVAIHSFVSPPFLSFMCHTSTTESGPKGIGNLSCALGILVQGHPKTSGLKHDSSLPSFSPSTPATFPSRPARTRSPSPHPTFPNPIPTDQDTSPSSTSPSRNTVFFTPNLATGTNSNGRPSNFVLPFPPPSPLPPTKTITFTRTVTEAPVTYTIISTRATTTTLQTTIIDTEKIIYITTLPPTTYTEFRSITVTETETTAITQTATVTPTATMSTSSSHESQLNHVSMVALVAGISSIVLVILVLIALLVLLCLCLYRRRKKSGASDFLKIPPSSITRPSRSHARPSSSTSLASVRSRDDPYPRTIRHDGRASQVSMMPNGDLPIGPSVVEYRHPNKTFTGPVDVGGVYGYGGEGAGSQEVSTLPSRFSETTVSSTRPLSSRLTGLWSVFRIRKLERHQSAASLA